MSIPKTSAGSGNIYLGSNLIAEGGCGKKTFEIDVRGKTQQQILYEGWLITGSVSTDSNGAYSSSQGSGIYKNIDLSKYSKVIITITCNIVSGSWINGIYCGIWYDGGGLRSGPRGETNNSYRGVYINLNGSEVYRSNNQISGDVDHEMEIDFSTYNMIYKTENGGNVYTYTYSVGQSNMQSLQQNSDYIGGFFPSGQTSHRLKTIKIELL